MGSEHFHWARTGLRLHRTGVRRCVCRCQGVGLHSGRKSRSATGSLQSGAVVVSCSVVRRSLRGRHRPAYDYFVTGRRVRWPLQCATQSPCSGVDRAQALPLVSSSKRPFSIARVSFAEARISVLRHLSLVLCPCVRFAGVADQRNDRCHGRAVRRYRAGPAAGSIRLVRFDTLSGRDRPRSDRSPVLEASCRSIVGPVVARVPTDLSAPDDRTAQALQIAGRQWLVGPHQPHLVGRRRPDSLIATVLSSRSQVL